jgi:hypothetical protein
MELQGPTKDRYISFCNIECDKNADKLIAMLDKHLEAGTGSEQWRNYFREKRSEQVRMGRDNLNLIGNQINPLYEYFDECDDEEAQSLLYQLEQECC